MHSVPHRPVAIKTNLDFLKAPTGSPAHSLTLNSDKVILDDHSSRPAVELHSDHIGLDSSFQIGSFSPMDLMSLILMRSV